MNSNSKVKLALDFINTTNKNIFLTGKAGTGKTTFLRSLASTINKRFIIVAPTGVAAINAGGVTIHSFFQLPFGPIPPEEDKMNRLTDESIKGKFNKFSQEKKNIIKSLDILIIDEISMVRADTLDAIDQMLRKYRRNNNPFGDVQLLMIGDMQQLPPVVKDDEWSILSPYYKSIYFFSSLALKKVGYINIEFTKVYRQQNQEFIQILNEIREGCISKESLHTLNQKIIPDLNKFNTDNFIILTTHNQTARNINMGQLNEIGTPSFYFNAEIEDNFPDYNYPTDEKLELKKDAQVMFIRNDSSPEKRYYNGKIGKIIEISENKLKVQCPTDDKPIDVEHEIWENIKYEIDDTTNEIKEKILGSFKQFPLRHAWAITIHKSQGLTFDKAIIDVKSAFAHGQTYVALSRCRNLEGLYLSAPISQHNIISNLSIIAFNKYSKDNSANNHQLHSNQITYYCHLLFDLFDFSQIEGCLKSCFYFLRDNAESVRGNLNQKLDLMIAPTRNEIGEVSEKFKTQIQILIQENPDIYNNTKLKNRISKAVIYFKDKIKQNLTEHYNQIEIQCDNKALKKRINSLLDDLEFAIRIKEKVFNASKEGFETDRYIQARSKAQIEKTSKKSSKKKEQKRELSSLKHSELYKKLDTYRQNTAQQNKSTVSQVFSIRTMINIANELPFNHVLLKYTEGVGKITLEKHGEAITNMVQDYIKEKGISIENLLKDKDVKKKKDTNTQSFEMFNEGATIAEIADKRGLGITTIEGHLCQFIEKGELDIFKITKKETVDIIKPIIQKHNESTLSKLRELLKNEYSYSEIKFVRAYVQSIINQKDNNKKDTPNLLF
ncbi:MAG: helix-turn-helix domain-containing protein [Bacteroidales bacterium]